MFEFPSLARETAAVEQTPVVTVTGRVTKRLGLLIESKGPPVTPGDLCRILPGGGGEAVPAEAVGFNRGTVLLMPLGDASSIGPGAVVVKSPRGLAVPVGRGLIGRVLDGLGRPIDGCGDIEAEDYYPLNRRAPSPLDRERITEALPTGVRAIDCFVTCGLGQRIGIFSGSGVGKSTLIGMIARNSSADVNVLALIGERGREVREFLEVDLGQEGLSRSVVVAATSDEPALVRIKAAFVATAVAEYFRDRGLKVMLMMDSLTRLAMAQREVGLASGEPPATRGYPPSVFALMPALLERAGRNGKGSITGIYSVLVDGDDLNEPVTDTVRGVLDGHVVLSRDLAAAGHYPPVDVLASISRLMPNIVDPKERRLADEARSLLAAYRDAEDLVNIGAYASGSNPRIDRAIEKNEALRAFLRQEVGEKCDFTDSWAKLEEILSS